VGLVPFVSSDVDVSRCLIFCSPLNGISLDRPIAFLPQAKKRRRRDGNGLGEHLMDALGWYQYSDESVEKLARPDDTNRI
jgi:hypothetical protein